MIPREQIEKVLSAANVVDFISDRIDLRRAGANYKACCPFHDEKTPSFVVSEAKQIFKCFGCGASGDVIKFIMLFDNLTYPEAIRAIAQKVGVEIVEEFSPRSNGNEDEVNRLDFLKDNYIKLLNLAADFFHNNLLDEIEEGSNNLLLEYLEKRDLSVAICRLYKIGYAPVGWNNIQQNASFAAVQDNLLSDVSLVRKNDKGRVYDFFRNRLMFPVFDVMGNTIAFSGRILNPDDIPKYINSSESLVYKKNKALFGFFQAKDAIRKTRKVVVVEGNLDQVSLFKHGVENCVALCGTALTDEHASILKRYCDSVCLMLDGDSAGVKATIRSADVLLAKGIETGIVSLPAEDDPDSYIERYGKNDLQNLIDKPLTILDFKLKIKGEIKTGDDRVSAARELVDSIGTISDHLKRDIYIKDAAEKLGVSREILEKELARKKDADKKNFRKKQLQETEEQRIDVYTYAREDEVEFNLLFIMFSSELMKEKCLKFISENFFYCKEAQQLFRIFYEFYEEGEVLKLNQALFGIGNENFTGFMINYFMQQDLAFGRINNDNQIADDLELSSEEKEAFEDKLETAYFDAMKKIIMRKVKKTIDGIQNRQDQLIEETAEQQMLWLRRLHELKKIEMECRHAENVSVIEIQAVNLNELLKYELNLNNSEV